MQIMLADMEAEIGIRDIGAFAGLLFEISWSSVARPYPKWGSREAISASRQWYTLTWDHWTFESQAKINIEVCFKYRFKHNAEGIFSTWPLIFLVKFANRPFAAMRKQGNLGSQLSLAASCTNDHFAKGLVITF